MSFKSLVIFNLRILFMPQTLRNYQQKFYMMVVVWYGWRAKAVISDPLSNKKLKEKGGFPKEDTDFEQLAYDH